MKQLQFIQGAFVKYLILLFVFLSFPLFAQDKQELQSEQDISNEGFFTYKDIHYHAVDYGSREEMFLTVEAVSTEDASFLISGVELPDYSRKVKMTVKTLLTHEEIFYPNILVLDENHEVLDMYQPSSIMPLKGKDIGAYYTIKLPVNAKYLLMSQSTELLGKKIYRMSGRYYDYSKPYRIGSLAVMKFDLPKENDSAPNYVSTGWEVGLGFQTGGDKVAEDEETNTVFDAGMGVVFYGGYSLPLAETLQINARAGLTYWSGEKGYSQGMMTQLNLGYHFPHWVVGAGLHSDLFYTIKGDDDVVYDFEDTVTPRVFLTWKASEGGWIEFFYKNPTYQTDREEFNGQSFGFFLNYFF